MGYTSSGSLEQFGAVEPMRAARRRTVERVGQRLHELTVERTPVAKPPPGHYEEWLQSRHGRLPGALRESWKLGEATLEGETESIEVYTRDPIAPYVEYPTLPHIIMPKRAGGVLRFWDQFGHTIYATIVYHTGTKGSYMLTSSLSEMVGLWQQIGAEEMQRWAREQQMLVH